MTAIDAHEALDETQATEFGRVFDDSATAVVIVNKYAFGGAVMTASARERVNALSAFTKELISARGPPRVDRDPGTGRLPMETRKS